MTSGRRARVRSNLQDLVDLIRETPECQSHISCHSDQRGLPVDVCGTRSEVPCMSFAAGCELPSGRNKHGGVLQIGRDTNTDTGTGTGTGASRVRIWAP